MSLLVLLKLMPADEQRSVIDSVLNCARHLRDQRLPWFDADIFHHPRKRITAGLMSLLKEPDDAAAEELLQLWGSYS